MGYTLTADAITIIAKFTPFGREQLLANRNNIITHFSLGDSDANYYVLDTLDTGETPNLCGNLGTDLSSNNSTAANYQIKNKVIVNTLGDTHKLVESNSTRISKTLKSVGSITLSGNNLTQDFIYKSDTVSSLGNLFRTFGLPLSSSENSLFNNVTNANGGASDTGLKLLNQDAAFVIGIDSNEYGEIIDGKTLHVNLTTSASSFNIYGTYQKSLTTNEVQNVNLVETSNKANLVGTNVVFLFSDDIKRPNNDLSKSWSTGYMQNKPFSVGKKELFNLVANPASNINMDVPVGVAYLDKGFIVITNPLIISSLDLTLTASTTFDTFSTEITQDVTCVVNRGEFISSNNPTYSAGDLIRVSEVGLHDISGNLIAVGKSDRHITIGANQFMAIGVKITI